MSSANEIRPEHRVASKLEKCRQYAVDPSGSSLWRAVGISLWMSLSIKIGWSLRSNFSMIGWAISPSKGTCWNALLHTSYFWICSQSELTFSESFVWKKSILRSIFSNIITNASRVSACLKVVFSLQTSVPISGSSGGIAYYFVQIVRLNPGERSEAGHVRMNTSTRLHEQGVCSYTFIKLTVLNYRPTIFEETVMMQFSRIHSACVGVQCVASGVAF